MRSLKLLRVVSEGAHQSGAIGAAPADNRDFRAPAIPPYAGGSRTGKSIDRFGHTLYLTSANSFRWPSLASISAYHGSGEASRRAKEPPAPEGRAQEQKRAGNGHCNRPAL